MAYIGDVPCMMMPFFHGKDADASDILQALDFVAPDKGTTYSLDADARLAALAPMLRPLLQGLRSVPSMTLGNRACPHSLQLLSLPALLLPSRP